MEAAEYFRCVSVDLLARRPVVHRQGNSPTSSKLLDAAAFLYAPLPYGGTLHVDGGVLDNVPHRAGVRTRDGPLIAVKRGLLAENQARGRRIAAYGCPA